MFYVYSCGSNGKYQLGTGECEDLNRAALVFECESPVKRIACGGNHTLLLLSNGELFACGDNSSGQCGLEGEEIRRFTRLEGLYKDCCAGFEFSVLIGQDDTIYSMGYGPKGELGLGAVTLAKKSTVPFDSTVSSIDSCLDHTVMLLENGDLYGWGNGRNGKLGDPKGNITSPRFIQANVEEFGIGRDFTVINDGQLHVLGRNRFNLPSGIEKFKCMWTSIHLADSEKLTSQGNDSHGQLNSPSEPVERFAVGSEHGIIARDQRVTTWGWGEHGNCGEDYEIKGFEGEISMIEGGCATTWVVCYKNV